MAPRAPAGRIARAGPQHASDLGGRDGPGPLDADDTRRYPLTLLGIGLAALAVSAVHALSPNDRIGHFAQGFVPAIIAGEMPLRRTPLRANGWLFFIVRSICLAISACYEFVEWWSAIIGGSKAGDFVGSLGDVWDTQWDMLYALIGSIVAQLTLSRVHERALGQVERHPERGYAQAVSKSRP